MLNCSRSQVCAWHCHYVCVNKDVQQGLVIVSLCVVCAGGRHRPAEGTQRVQYDTQASSGRLQYSIDSFSWPQMCSSVISLNPFTFLKQYKSNNSKQVHDYKAKMFIDVCVCFRKRGSACPWMESGNTVQTRKSLHWQRSWLKTGRDSLVLDPLYDLHTCMMYATVKGKVQPKVKIEWLSTLVVRESFLELHNILLNNRSGWGLVLKCNRNNQNKTKRT